MSLAGKRQDHPTRNTTEATGFAKPSDCLRATVRGEMVRRFVLTPRQLQVLEWLSEGMDVEQIAAQLERSERTVEDVISDLIGATFVHDRAGLVARWVQLLYEAVDAFGLHLPPHPEHGHRLPKPPPITSWRPTRKIADKTP